MIGRGQWKEVLRMIAALALVLVAGFAIRTLEAAAVAECSRPCRETRTAPALEERSAPATEGGTALHLQTVERHAPAPLA